jgi:hypothetical protein
VEFRRVSEGSQGSLAFQNNRHSDLIERRSIAIAILNNTAKEILSEIDRSALSLVDRGFIRLQSRSAIMRTTNAQPTIFGWGCNHYCPVISLASGIGAIGETKKLLSIEKSRGAPMDAENQTDSWFGSSRPKADSFTYSSAR